ncbi:MAG: hypothetical protein E6R08_01145 [Nevskiaceae bacterium]|nr:MAG: hypothetical protein E6R08_01145 [Nevskiaceae bacterium]
MKRFRLSTDLLCSVSIVLFSVGCALAFYAVLGVEAAGGKSLGAFGFFVSPALVLLTLGFVTQRMAITSHRSDIAVSSSQGGEVDGNLSGHR